MIDKMDVPDFQYAGDDDDDTSQHPRTSAWDAEVVPGEEQA